MHESGVPEGYAREEVRRMLGISEQQLRSWEKAGFVEGGETYSFHDLVALRNLRNLRENRVPSRQISQAIDSLKRFADLDHPLAQARFQSDGRNLTVQIAGEKLEPISGQLLFNFDAVQGATVRMLTPPPPNKMRREREAEMWFQRGLTLEETGAPPKEIIEAYEAAVALNPYAAGALVNLGTVYYRLRKYDQAQKFYEAAIAADAAYPLAHFNLGNLYDEKGDAELATQFYVEALRLNPGYADAHFNLALLCERRGEALKAINHWRAYLKLDGSSSWSNIARRQLEKLMQATVIPSR